MTLKSSVFIHFSAENIHMYLPPCRHDDCDGLQWYLDVVRSVVIIYDPVNSWSFIKLGVVTSQMDEM